MMRVLSIGECMVELAPGQAPDSFQLGFAGDTLNTAWYLRALLPAQWHIDYFTAVGSDALSDRMRAFLDAAGVGTGHILRRSDRTVGLYMIELVNGERSFAYWRGESAARTMLQDPAPLAAALAGAELGYFSGITLAILAPADRARLLATLGAFRGQGGQVAFDPNLRARLWPGEAAMTAAISAAAAFADIVLPSFDDEARAFGDANPEATAERYAALGARTVVVKNGSGAIFGLSGGQRVQVAAPEVAEVVDTTAAGDSFNASFLAAHLAGEPLQAAIAAGADLAARVITRRGALVDLGQAFSPLRAPRAIPPETGRAAAAPPAKVDAPSGSAENTVKPGSAG